MNFESLKEFLDVCLPSLSIPGSDTVIYKDHEEVFRYQSGFDSLAERTPVRPDALYHMYSVTKVSTCVAATQLIERGEILVTDPISAYFPEFRHMGVKVKREDGRTEVVDAKNPILIKHLLTMTAGMDYNLSRPAINRVRAATAGRCPTLDIVRALAEEPLCFEPGTDYGYSLCLDVIGGLVELVSGKPLGDYMKDNIFDPLGMCDTTFRYPTTESGIARMATQYKYEGGKAVEIPKDSNPFVFGGEYDSGGAGLISSVDDQILLADALTNMGMGKSGNRILSSYGVNLMRTNNLHGRAHDTYNTKHLTGYGYGYGVRTNLYPEQAGNLMPVGEFGWDGAKLSYLSACPENGVAIFHAEHMGSLHATVIPRLRNIIYHCLDA